MNKNSNFKVVEEVLVSDSPISVNVDCLRFIERPSYYRDEFVLLEVEGEKELSVLCPCSKLTGFPMSMQQALFMVTDNNARIADMLFQPLEEVRTSDLISDDDKFRLLVSRLDTGSFFENDAAAEVLGKVVKEFMPDVSKESVDKVVESAQAKINFEDTSVPEGGES